jgi:hypothetical protein
VIARILGSGQFEISDDVHRQLDALDEQAVAAIDASDEETLDGLLAQMAELVEAEGTRLPDDYLGASDVVIPPPDLTLEETRALFSEQGLIPDIPVA